MCGSLGVKNFGVFDFISGVMDHIRYLCLNSMASVFSGQIDISMHDG